MAIELFLGAVTAAAITGASYTFSDASVVTYTLVHPAHTVVGTTSQISGTVTVNGQVIATPFKLDVALASFDSGNSNRDSNALEALRAIRFPKATLVVNTIVFDWKTYKPATIGGRLDFKGTATGTLAIRGVTKPLTFPIEGWAMPADARVSAKFPVSLAEYGIPAPSLMFVPTKDRVDVEVEAIARRVP